MSFQKPSIANVCWFPAVEEMTLKGLNPKNLLPEGFRT